MAIEKLSVILELITGNYKKEARDAATATGQIGSAAATAGSSTSGMAGRMGAAGSLIKTAFAGVAVAAIGDVIGDLDQLGQKMESTERMAETVFGDMVEDARAWADQNNEAFGIGESAMLSLISKTQDLLVPMGFARDAAYDMSKGILDTANALSEWEGGTITAEDAQLRLAKALLGEREGLVELGIKITDAEVKARLAAKGMDKLTGAAKQQAIAQVTLELVTEKSTDALAAYEGRAGTATAAQKELAASTADTAESWAELLRGPLDTAKGTLADVTDIAQFLSEKMAENAGKTDDATESADGLVQVWGTAQPVMAAVIDILGWLADKTKETVVPAQDAQVAYQFMTDTLRNKVIPVGYDTIAMLDNQFASHRNVAKAADTQRQAMINLATVEADLLDPVRKVLLLHQEAITAEEELDRVRGDEKATTADLALAVIDVEQAQLRLNGAGAALTAEQIIAFSLALQETLGLSETAVLDLLDAMGLLDGFEVNAKVNVRIAEINAGAISNTQIQVRQHGGPVRRGQPYLVGEQGVELMVPDQSGMILPHGAALGGGVTYVTNQGSTIVVQSPMGDFHSDLQYAALIASVTNLVEGF